MTGSAQLDRAKAQAARHVDDLAEELCGLARRLYGEPEVGLQEELAAGWLAGFLEARGFEVERGVGGLPTAFRARMRRGEVPTVALLAEYDALPEIGHGCGHNLIGPATCGAAAALAAPPWAGTLVVLGCPAEEGAVDGAGGKVHLLRAGLFDGVDAAMMFHPSNQTVVRNSSIAREAMEITFRGRAAHAAGSPHEGINALEAALLTFNSINALRQHLKEGVRVHGIITRGGVAANIVPEEGQVRLYVRAADREYLDEVAEKVRNCARGASLATGAEVEFRATAEPYENLVTNEPLARAFEANLQALGSTPDHAEVRGTGSTDMGNVSQVVPAIHPYLAICDSDVPGHSRDFAAATVQPRGLDAMLLGAKTLAWTALDVFHRPALTREAWEHRRGSSG